MLLVAEPLELNATFAELFQRCANEPWALFLDSCDNGSGEWDFIFRQPESVVTEPQHWPQQLEQLLAQTPPYQGQLNSLSKAVLPVLGVTMLGVL